MFFFIISQVTQAQVSLQFIISHIYGCKCYLVHFIIHFVDFRRYKQQHMDSCKLATCYYWQFSGSTTDSSDVINRWSFGLILALHHLLVEICVLVLLLMGFRIFLEQFDCLNSKFKMSIHVQSNLYIKAFQGNLKMCP